MNEMTKLNPPKMALVVPCYNEEQVLPKTALLFADKIRDLCARRLISTESFILLCNDGSKDNTWGIIKSLAAEDRVFRGLSLSRNRGHQNVLLAGLMEIKECSDIVVSIDCDGQDDINAIDVMIEKWRNGVEVVYGARNKRLSDTWFKRTTAELFYKIMIFLGADVVYNHADYRLASSRVLRELENFGEVNLFLRGIFPLVGFKSDIVYYERHQRIAGESHYPFLKMLGFAWDGVTSLSIKPIRMISVLGLLLAGAGIGMIGWCFISYFTGQVLPGWVSFVAVSSLIGGVQMLSVGVIGEYIGKMYLETKRRPRYIISERTYGDGTLCE